MQKLDIYCDGGARGNPGPAAGAFVVFASTKKVFEGSKYLGVSTNNVAEYEAVVLALTFLSQTLKELKNYELSFNLDSELVARQLTGRYKIKNTSLQTLSLQVKKLESLFSCVSYNNIPRSKNADADALVNKQLDATT